MWSDAEEPLETIRYRFREIKELNEPVIRPHCAEVPVVLWTKLDDVTFAESSGSVSQGHENVSFSIKNEALRPVTLG